MELINEYITKEEDIRKIEDIENEYFPKENITSSDEVLKWVGKNDKTIIGVMDKETKEVLGSITILPLSSEVFGGIYNNEFNEVDIKDIHIEKYEENKTYNLYFSAIAIKKEYKNNIKILKMLLRGFTNFIDEHINKNISFNGLMADVISAEGRKLCKGLLDMNYVRRTDHNTEVFYLDKEGFYKSIENLKRHIK